MFRSIPVSNKLCFDQELKRSWRIHEQKLKNLRGSVGKQKPQQFAFLDYRLKKNALIEIKNIEIGRENKVLLRKMQEIETKRCKNSYLCEGIQQKKKTLNEPYRKRELVKIVEQNQDIMKRLDKKKSAYNIKKMKQERIQVQKNISLISQFPYKNYRCKNTPTNLWMTDDNFKQKNNTTSKHQTLTLTVTRKINNKYYLISTYLKQKIFYIQMQNLQHKNDRYRMQMEENQIRNLLTNSYNHDINQIIQNLQIDDSNRSCYLKYQVNIPS